MSLNGLLKFRSRRHHRSLVLLSITPLAVVIGLIAGVLVVSPPSGSSEKLKIDDSVGAVPVHMVNGAWGASRSRYLCQWQPSIPPHGDGCLPLPKARSPGFAVSPCNS